MSRILKISPVLALLVIGVAGCGAAPPKELPKVTPEKQAELDKGHAEAKAKTDAAPGGATK